jgi:Family of unknown function (DUF6499)
MPHTHMFGTGWDKTRADFCYLDQLDKPGLAWEFLRRNVRYQRDFKQRENCLSDNPSVQVRQQESSDNGPMPMAYWGLVRFRRPDIDGITGAHLLGWTQRQNCCLCTLFWKP